MTGVNSTQNNMNSTSTSMQYSKIASGKKVNKAADDAAALSIIQKMEQQKTGLNVGADNAKDGSNFLNVAEGALGGMNDYLQRIKELSLKASSGLNSADSLKAIQDEINQNLAGIQDLSKGTEFNGMKPLDGSMASLDIATNPDGTGMKIQMENSSLESLGIDGYDVTKSFDMNKIDNAMNMVSNARSSLGASTNALGAAYSYNTSAALEQMGAQSRLEDLDMAQAVSDKKKTEVLDEYKLMMQKKQMEEADPLKKLL